MFSAVLLFLVRYLNKFLSWFLFTSLFAACCAVGLTMATERLLLEEVPGLLNPLHFFVFGCTLVVYNVHYIIKRSSADISDRFAWSQHYMTWHYLAFGTGFLLSALSLFLLPLKIWLWCGILGLLSFAYSLPLLPIKNKRRLKDFGWVKIIVLTSVWTIVTSVLPMLYWGRAIADYPFEILLRWVLMFTLCVAFDIRDMQTDLEANIFTLPNIIGLKNSYRLIDFTILLFAVLSIIQHIRYPSITRLTGAMVTCVATKLVIEYTKKHPSDRVYLGMVDGMMLFYSLLVLWH